MIVDKDGKELVNKAELEAQQARMDEISSKLHPVIEELGLTVEESMQVAFNFVNMALSATPFITFQEQLKYLFSGLRLVVDQQAVLKQGERQIAEQMAAANQQGQPS